LVPHHQDANDYYNHHSYPSRNPQEEEDDDDDDDSGDGTNNINDSGRQHWMPDKLCKHCYSCEVQFTVFRRRHHCRLCGQVFCSACSAYFVDLAPTVHSEEEEGVSPAGHATTQTKHSGLTSIGKVEGATPHDTISGPFDRKDTGATSSTVASASGVGFASATGDSLAQSRTMRACKMCYDQVSRSGGIVSISSSPNMTRSTAVSEVITTTGTPADLASTNPSTSLLASLKESSPSVIPSEKILSELDSSTHDVVGANNISLPSTHQLLDNDQASMISEQQQDVHHDGDKVPPNNDSLDSKALPAEMHPSVMTRTGSGTQLDTTVETAAAAPENSIKEANRHLGLMAATHLEKMGKELLLSDAPLLIEELQASTKQDDVDGLLAPWIDKIMMLATRCCATVKPNVKKGDLLDIRPYCKIKGKELTLSDFIS
jgi:1-phosphatidylinositol-3-phosphate 5-kinase